MNIASISADIATLCSREGNISPVRLQRKSCAVSRLPLSDFPLNTLLAIVTRRTFPGSWMLVTGWCGRYHFLTVVLFGCN